ncbi:MAG: DUF5309 domain-containing protein, partial [Alteromonadales bacterium]|nr:DUF5309 domain-containing protein [Alteromonadales bacterium]
FYVNAIIQMVNVKYRITAINATGLVLTLAVVNGTDADRAAGVVITVLTNAIAEGGGGVINARNPEVKRTNTTQIMFDIMQISKSAGLSAQEVDGKEFAKQVADKMAQFRNDTRGLLWSDYYEAADTKGDIAIAGGIPHYVHANGYNPTATALNAVNLSEFVRHLYDNIGATPKELWMNPVDRATISTTFDATFFRRDADSTRRGVVAETFMTT